MCVMSQAKLINVDPQPRCQYPASQSVRFKIDILTSGDVLLTSLETTHYIRNIWDTLSLHFSHICLTSLRLNTSIARTPKNNGRNKTLRSMQHTWFIPSRLGYGCHYANTTESCKNE